jgi:hypothetical protein
MIWVLLDGLGVVVQLLGLNVWAWVANYRQIVFTFAVWAMERGEGKAGWRRRGFGEKNGGGHRWLGPPGPIGTSHRATAKGRGHRFGPDRVGGEPSHASATQVLPLKAAPAHWPALMSPTPQQHNSRDEVGPDQGSL